MLDPVAYPREELLKLYARRWHCELRLRDLKISLHMDVLRTKTPSMVRKELLAKLLVYNLIRTQMWEAGLRSGQMPLRISFKGTVQHFRIFAPFLANLTPGARAELHRILLNVIAQEIIPLRKDRVEPRLKKRRPKSYGWIQMPRSHYQRLLHLNRPLK